MASKLPLIMIIILTNQTALAVESITDAFGIKLGQIFLPSQAKTIKYEFNSFGVWHTSKYTIMEFKPEVRSPFFTKYYLYVSPKSYKVYKIKAVSKPYNCNRDYAIVKEALKSKYNNGNNMRGKSLIKIDNESINLDCSTSNQLYVSSNLIKFNQPLASYHLYKISHKLFDGKALSINYMSSKYLKQAKLEVQMLQKMEEKKEQLKIKEKSERVNTSYF